jgi:hypothetical protein
MPLAEVGGMSPRSLLLVGLLSAAAACADGGHAPTSSPACDATDAPLYVAFRIDRSDGVIPKIAQNQMMLYDVSGVLSDVARVTEPCPSTCTLQLDGCNGSCLDYPGGQCPACPAAGIPALRLSIEDADGKVTTITASAQAALADWEAVTSALRGTSVHLRVHYRMGFQVHVAIGFVLSDAAGVALASDGGRYVNALDPSDTPGLTLTQGAAVCRTDGCLGYRATSFRGTTSADVAPGHDGAFMMGPQRYVARNGGAVQLGADCGSDFEAASPWSIWRAAP